MASPQQVEAEHTADIVIPRRPAHECAEKLLMTTNITRTFVEGGVKRKKTVTLTLEELTDEEFDRWVNTEVGGVDVKNRLRRRALTVDLIPYIRGFKDDHWCGG